MYISRHVIFHEDLFPYNLPEYKFHSSVTDILPSNCSNHALTMLDSPVDISTPLVHLPSDPPFSTHHITPPPLVLILFTNNDTVNHHPMTTRSKACIFKQKIFNTETVLQSHVPTSMNEAISSSSWFQAMNDEYISLLNNHTWSLTPILDGAKFVGCKSIFKNKYHADDSFQSHKARLVAK